MPLQLPQLGLGLDRQHVLRRAAVVRHAEPLFFEALTLPRVEDLPMLAVGWGEVTLSLDLFFVRGEAGKPGRNMDLGNGKRA